MVTIDVAISIELQRIGVGTLKLRYRDLPHYNKMFDVGVIKFYNRYGPRELCLWFVELAITYGEFYHPKVPHVEHVSRGHLETSREFYQRLYGAMEESAPIDYGVPPELLLIDHEGEAGVYFITGIDYSRDSEIFTRRREID